MTNKEFYNAVINAEISDEVTEKATLLLQRIEDSNSAKVRKKAEADAPLIQAVTEILTGKAEPTLASEIATTLQVHTSKAAALAKKVEGVQIVEVKVNGRKVNGYLLPTE